MLRMRRLHPYVLLLRLDRFSEHHVEVGTLGELYVIAQHGISQWRSLAMMKTTVIAFWALVTHSFPDTISIVVVEACRSVDIDTE